MIGVVDSGIEVDHPDLAANIHPTLAFDFLDDDTDATPDATVEENTRGTAVAGIIAAAMSSLDSAMNSLSAATQRDFLERFGAPGNLLAQGV